MHPIVRTTPLGQKVLYVNNGFTRRIEGLKEEESSYLLNFYLIIFGKVMTFKLELTGNQTRWLYLITELLVTLPFLILILLIQD